MKILFLCQYFPPEMGAPAARTWEHTRHWASKGHDVTVVTGFPNHPTGIIRPEYRGMYVRREWVEGVSLLRTWVYCAANKGFFRRVLNFLSFFFSSLLLGGLMLPRPEVVIGTSPQFFCAVAAWLLSWWKRVPFVFEVRDIWPLSAIELGAITNRWLISILEAIELHLYRQSRAIVIVAESTRPYLLARGIPAEKIVLIPNGLDDRFIESPTDSPETIRERLGLKDKFVVSYIGTLGMSHALETMIEAATAMRDDAGIHFLLIGEGAEKAQLMAMAAERQPGNITFLPEQPRESLPGFYRASDLGIVSLKNLPVFTKVLPSKLFELMGAGCPIVCSVAGEAAQLVDRSGAGICIAPENEAALREAINTMRNDPTRRREMARAGREFVRAHYARSVLADRYLEALCERI